MNAIELNKQIKNGLKAKLFDIRTKDKYDYYHIEGAINVERGKLISFPEKYLNKNDKAYILCNSGNSASLVSMILTQKNYDLEVIEQGMNPLLKNLK